jgi:uncharacterized protein YaiI (UPF0178 family)
MIIWVDADACPKSIKEILYRAAERTQTSTILIANQSLQIPVSPFIKKRLVASGFDVADNHIIEEVSVEDLVITADIPLAHAVVVKGAHALNPRGEFYTKENIKQRLAIRNFSEELRSTGKITGGPAKLSQKEIREFSNRLDQFLTANKKSQS